MEEQNILSQFLSVSSPLTFCGEGVIKVNNASRKLAAAASALILAGLLTFFNVPIRSIQSQASSQPVDVAVTDITNVANSLVYFSGPTRYNGTNVPINVSVSRLDDNTLAPSVDVSATLNRTNVLTLENVTVSNTTISLGPAETNTVSFLWNESLNTLSAGNYDMYCFADLISSDVYDTNMTNNIMTGGMVRVAVFKEDLNGDGAVGMGDLGLLAKDYGQTGPPGWIPEDLMPDGVIDSFDLSMLTRVWGLSWSQPRGGRPIPWNLTISAPPAPPLSPPNANDSVVVFSDYIVYSNNSFNVALKQLSFNITSSIDGFCNVTIPKTSMSGAFTVYLDDVPTPSIVTSNETHYFVYFTSTGLSQTVRIVSEYAQEILGDVNHDGVVDILDDIILSNHFQEHS
jgi:hypothetical protein